MLIAFGGQLSFFAFQPTYALWVEKVMLAGYEPKLVQQAIGYILALVGLVGLITQTFWVKPIVRRFGERAMVAGGLFVRALPWLVMATVPYIFVNVAMAPLISFGNGMVGPGLVALLTYLVPPNERGYAIGLSEAVQGIGRIVAPIIAGQLFERISPSAPMAFAGVVGLISAAVALLLWRVPVMKPALLER
jgi:DHA1 family tetracycline resistance protein-like MFS transporter